MPHTRLDALHYPAVSIGCCFHKREANYQLVLESIERIADCYPGDAHAYIYLSDESDAARLTSRFRLRKPSLFSFASGENRLDEPKYRLPLQSDAPFVLTLDDDCTFSADILTILVDAYHTLQQLDAYLYRLSPVGWFGTELEAEGLLVPIEGRYNLAPGEMQRVDYLGSCGALFPRELLADLRMDKANWPAAVGAASDLWLSFLLFSQHRTPAYITHLNMTPLPECGHSLWNDANSSIFPAAVRQLVQRGWQPFNRGVMTRGRVQIPRHDHAH